MKFYVKQKVFSLKDRFYIRNSSGEEVYQVEGKMFSLQNELKLATMNGEHLLTATKKVFSILSKYTLRDARGEVVANVNRKFGLKPKFEVLIGHEELDVEGSFWGYNFTVSRNHTPIATIQKQVLAWGDTYEIDVLDQLNVELYLFIVVIIDQILHENKNND